MKGVQIKLNNYIMFLNNQKKIFIHVLVAKVYKESKQYMYFFYKEKQSQKNGNISLNHVPLKI